MEGGGAGASEGGGGKASKRPREEEEGEEGRGSRCVRPILGRLLGSFAPVGRGGGGEYLTSSDPSSLLSLPRYVL